MRSLQARSTHWRATCSYPTHGIDFRDYLRGNFKDFKIVDYIRGGQCKTVEYINIRGHVGKNLTVPFWQFRDQGLHIDSPSTHCQFKAASSGAVSSEDNLGWYYNSRYNPKFRCIPSPQPSGGLELISSPFGDKTGCILVINALKEIIISIN